MGPRVRVAVGDVIRAAREMAVRYIERMSSGLFDEHVNANPFL